MSLPNWMEIPDLTTDPLHIALCAESDTNECPEHDDVLLGQLNQMIITDYREQSDLRCGTGTVVSMLKTPRPAPLPQIQAKPFVKSVRVIKKGMVHGTQHQDRGN